MLNFDGVAIKVFIWPFLANGLSIRKPKADAFLVVGLAAPLAASFLPLFSLGAGAFAAILADYFGGVTDFFITFAADFDFFSGFSGFATFYSEARRASIAGIADLGGVLSRAPVSGSLTGFLPMGALERLARAP